MTPEQHEVRRYYERLGTWLGYDLVLGGAKHLGFYPSAQKDRSEQAARSCMHDEIARRLRLKVGQHILDAGCGQGIASVDIAKRYGVHVTGITIVPFEATRARRHARRHEVTHHTDYQVMDYSSTSFPADHLMQSTLTKPCRIRPTRQRHFAKCAESSNLAAGSHSRNTRSLPTMHFPTT